MEGKNVSSQTGYCPKQWDKDCPPSCPVWFVMDLGMAFRDLFWEKIWWMKSPVSETCALTGVQLTCCAEKKFQVLAQILPGRRDGSLSRYSSSFNTVWEGYFLHFKTVFLVSCWEKKWIQTSQSPSDREKKGIYVIPPTPTLRVYLIQGCPWHYF